MVNIASMKQHIGTVIESLDCFGSKHHSGHSGVYINSILVYTPIKTT